MTRSTTQLRSLWAPPCTGPFIRYTLYGGGVVSVRPAIIDAVRGLDAWIRHFSYAADPQDTGAYNCRHITGGTGYSLHAYGIALDIDWNQNPYGHVLKTNMPPAMVAAIQGMRTNSGAQVWRWGGTYSGNKDAMHYEIVAAPSEIATGIAQSTLPHPANTDAAKFAQEMLNIVRKTWKGAIQIRVDGNILSDQSKAAIEEFQVRWNNSPLAHTGPGLLHVSGALDDATSAAIGISVHLVLKR